MFCRASAPPVARGLCAAAALALAACSPEPPATWSGYAVGDFVYVAAPLAGTLESLEVRASDTVARGAPLFELDAASETAARDEAAARLQAAQAQQANLEKGRRADEQAVIRAQLAQAQVALALAQREVERQQRLLAQGFVSLAQVDDASTRQRAAAARVDELSAALRVAQLPARGDEQQASRANVAAAGGALRLLERQLEKTRRFAPAAGVVNDVFFRPGEFVPAGQPVLALLPPGNIKLRFFVPEAELSGIRLGQSLAARCDGCDAPLQVRVSHIAAQAEYTPPVIYSNAQRARLVFMVEARPESADAVRLHPGQPVDVERPAAGTP